VKSDTNLSRQLFFVSDRNIRVLSFPIVLADINNSIVLLGCFGHDVNALAPAAIEGNLANQSFSFLIHKALATKHRLPLLTVDLLKLEAPAPSNASPGPNRLHVSFTDPEHTPVSAALPAMFPAPLGVTAPCNRTLNDKAIAKDNFPSKAGRAWVQAAILTNCHCDELSIHTHPEVFNPANLDCEPFTDHNFAPNIRANLRMLLPMLILSVTAFSPWPTRKSRLMALASLVLTTRPLLPIPMASRRARIGATLRWLTSEKSPEGAANANKNKESQADKEASATFKESIARHKLLFACLVNTPDPANPSLAAKRSICQRFLQFS
jgi:hypothetical protein